MGMLPNRILKKEEIQEIIEDKTDVASQIVSEYRAKCGLSIVIYVYNGAFPLLVMVKRNNKILGACQCRNWL